MGLFQTSVLEVARPGTTLYQLCDAGRAPSLSAPPFLGNADRDATA